MPKVWTNETGEVGDRSRGGPRLRQVCMFNGCEKPHDADGRCGTHRAFFDRNGRDGGKVQCVEVIDGERCKTKTKAFIGEESTARCSKHRRPYCRVRRCPFLAINASAELCDGHRQARRAGRELLPLNSSYGRRKPEGMDALAWFAKLIAVSEEHPHCWTWRGPNNGRYGSFTVAGENCLAHRWSVEHIGGVNLGDEDQVDHDCRNKLCVHPGHLKVLSVVEHHQVERHRNAVLKEAGEGVIWGADPEAGIAGSVAFQFALKHGLPFKTENITREVAPRGAPIIEAEAEELSHHLQGRETWLRGQGLTEESYCIPETR